MVIGLQPMEPNGLTLTTMALGTIRTERTVTSSPTTRYVGPILMVTGTQISKEMMPSSTTQLSGMTRMVMGMEIIKMEPMQTSSRTTAANGTMLTVTA